MRDRNFLEKREIFFHTATDEHPLQTCERRVVNSEIVHRAGNALKNNLKKYASTSKI